MHLRKSIQHLTLKGCHTLIQLTHRCLEIKSGIIAGTHEKEPELPQVAASPNKQNWFQLHGEKQEHAARWQRRC